MTSFLLFESLRLEAAGSTNKAHLVCDTLRERGLNIKISFYLEAVFQFDRRLDKHHSLIG